MINPNSPSTVADSHELPPITVDGHALFEFSLQMNLALKRLVSEHYVERKNPVPYARQLWTQPPKKPR